MKSDKILKTFWRASRIYFYEWEWGTKDQCIDLGQSNWKNGAAKTGMGKTSTGQTQKEWTGWASLRTCLIYGIN